MGEVSSISSSTGGGIVAPFADLGVDRSRTTTAEGAASVTVVVNDGTDTITVSTSETVIGGHGGGDRCASERDGLSVGRVGDGNASVCPAGIVAILAFVVVIKDVGIIAKIVTTALGGTTNVDISPVPAIFGPVRNLVIVESES